MLRGKKFPLDFYILSFYNVFCKMNAEICVPEGSVDLPEFFKTSLHLSPGRDCLTGNYTWSVIFISKELVSLFWNYSGILNPEVAQIIQNNTLNTFLNLFYLALRTSYIYADRSKSCLTPPHGIFHGYLLLGNFEDAGWYFRIKLFMYICGRTFSDKMPLKKLSEDFRWL